jgi:hypothetical protein
MPPVGCILLVLPTVAGGYQPRQNTAMTDTETSYESISITVEDGELQCEYMPKGGKPQRMTHDEDVSDWTQDDCIKCVVGLLGLTDAEAKQIDFAYA